MSVEASSPAVDHPLASLTAGEIQQAAAIFDSNPAVDVAPPGAREDDGHAHGAEGGS